MKDLDKNEILLAIEKVNQNIDLVKEDLQKELKEKLEVIPKMQEQLKVIPEMQEELCRISRTVAKIELEHGEKLSALFDAFSTLSQKLDMHDKRISKCEKQIENHNNQIYYLNSKIQEL